MQVSVGVTEWGRRQHDSPAAVCFQIVQTMSFHFRKKRASVWLSEISCHPWAKLIVPINMFCSAFPKRKTCFLLVHAFQPNHLFCVAGLGWREGDRAEGHFFQFHLTLLAWNTSWNNMTQRKSFYVKLCGLENYSAECFMIFLSRPCLMMWSPSATMASFLWRLEHFQLQKNLKRCSISKAIA